MAINPISEAQKFLKTYKVEKGINYGFAEDFVKLPDAVQKAIIDKLPEESRIILSSSLTMVARLMAGPLSDKAKQLIKYKEEPQFRGFLMEHMISTKNGKNIYETYQTYGFSHIILGSDRANALRVFC